MSVLVSNALIVNEGKVFRGHLVLDGEVIQGVYEDAKPPFGIYDEVVDAEGCVVMPGVIDTHVHFREPGLTAKADMESESRAAAYGGVTTFFDMPNTIPQTVTVDALEDKMRIAHEKSHVNYAFFFGATNDNIPVLSQLDSRVVPGVKLFMGSSTGNMLVDDENALRHLFRSVSLPIMAHCEDTAMINQLMSEACRRYGEDPPLIHHPDIRSEEACFSSSSLAVRLAREYGSRLHLAHLSTARELELLDSCVGDTMPRITGEVVIAHLMFSDEDYTTLGTGIKCNPAVKTAADRLALRKAVGDGRIFTVATDHAPHLLTDKEGGCRKAASGMPMVQFSLPCMLQMVDEKVLTLERMVSLMCHHPAMLFGIERRGFLRPGYKADVTVVRPDSPWTISSSVIQSRCGWSPLMGKTFNWRVEHTFCNGRHLLSEGCLNDGFRGQQVTFCKR